MKFWRFPKGVLLYAMTDYVSAILSWFIFVVYRRIHIENRYFYWELFCTKEFIYGIILVPIILLMIHIIFDSYRNIYRMSRLSEIARTIIASLSGSLFLFFTIIIDDLTNYLGGYRGYYLAILGFFGIHFLLTIFFRMWHLNRASKRIKTGKFSFNTIFIGQHPKLEDLYLDIIHREHKLGYNFVGYINALEQNTPNPLAEEQPQLGSLEQLSDIIVNEEIEEVIIGLSSEERTKLKDVLIALDKHNQNLLIKVLPELYDVLLGKVKINHPYGTILMEIKTHFIPFWLRFTKRAIDIVTSILVLLLLSPLYLFVAIKVRFSSIGPIFYKQERIGRNGMPFMIYKFRSMYTDAEKAGPQLSSDTDDRCTPWGRIMRKYRLDEIPQFWNVLKGDMSLVGPRPERQFYIDQIAKKTPRVHQLHKVRPGITSLGQVKYGYASNVDEMVQRLKLDILYIENLSLGLDIKILFYTVLVILKGSGK